MSCFGQTEETTLDWTGGDTEYLIMYYKYADKVTPVDMTGASAHMQIKKTLTESNPTLSVKTATIDTDTGRIEFKFDPTETELLCGSRPKSKYIYDVQLTYSSGDVETLAGGKIIVVLGVTS